MIERRGIHWLASSLLGVTLLAACGSSNTNSSSGSGTTAAELAAATAAVHKLTGPTTDWTGPTSGPAAKPHANIAFVSLDQKNPAVSGWGDAIQQAASHIGWHVTIYDGKGTTDGQLTAFQAALAAKPDGIILGALQVDSFQPTLGQALQLHIPVVGIHSAGDVGPYASQNMFYNVAQRTADIGAAAADYVIVDSGGKGKAVILTDRAYTIAVDKATAEQTELQKCGGCTVLSFENAPLATITTRAGQLVTSLQQRYGSNLQYMVSIADFYYDVIVPALRSAGVQPSAIKLVGTDGTSTAYQRIRTGDYQVATVPGSLSLEGWSAVDELNRAMNGQQPFMFPLPVHLVDKSNVDQEGGNNDAWIPGNNFQQHYLQIWGGQ